MLTYIGFDGISTLSEEVHNPRRNILLATVLVCLITGVLASVQVYAAQLVWPDNEIPRHGHRLRLRGRAGGWAGPFHDRQPRAAGGHDRLRLGRAPRPAAALRHGPRQRHPGASSAPSKPGTRIPATTSSSSARSRWSVAFTLSYQLGAELLNFGAFIAFMGVNLAALRALLVARGAERRLRNFLPPLLGFLICLYIWLSLRPTAKLAGALARRRHPVRRDQDPGIQAQPRVVRRANGISRSLGTPRALSPILPARARCDKTWSRFARQNLQTRVQNLHPLPGSGTPCCSCSTTSLVRRLQS